MTHAFKQSFLLLATVKINAQCSNFSNSISINAPGSTNGCFNNNPNATSNICVQYNINFSNGNASFYWGHIVSNNGQSTTTTHGPVNTSQTENYPGAESVVDQKSLFGLSHIPIQMAAGIIVPIQMQMLQLPQLQSFLLS